MNIKGFAIVLGCSLVLLNVAPQTVGNPIPVVNAPVSNSFMDYILEQERKKKVAQIIENRKPENMRAYTLSSMKKYGWGKQQYSCLYSLWKKESNWRWNAGNKSSGAYGIPQAWPAWKMRHAGSDWKTNPFTQIEWGLGYIKRNHGSPCNAWKHSEVSNWY